MSIATLRPENSDEYSTYFTQKISDFKGINSNTEKGNFKSLFALSQAEDKCSREIILYEENLESLSNHDLYPWNWSENSESAVNVLCSILTENSASDDMLHILSGLGNFN
jgi:hypothetical protein